MKDAKSTVSGLFRLLIENIQKYNSDGSKRCVPRPGFTWEDVDENRRKAPKSGSIEDLKKAIIERKGYI